MAEIRGMVYGLYVPDHGIAFAIRQSETDFAQASFGWTAASAINPMSPKGFRARRVHGISATSGRRGSRIVPDVTADIWTGVALTFVDNTDALTTDTYTVTGYTAEKMTIPH